MKITLRIKGEDKTFVNDYVPARLLREALKVNEDMAKNKVDGTHSVADQLDELAEFAVKAFNFQFTLDELWDGIELKRFQSELSRVFNEVLGLGGLALKGNEDEGK
ncbi:hypothetical protein AAGS61_03015 [Lysinibacillus sp. KU-BSD001]|uniref:phage tail assembly chaperone G n=1 Tax=Lysinibacillus sp. KU-BSD001 TaxID=3141328 RepID=UPI0036EC96FB